MRKTGIAPGAASGAPVAGHGPACGVSPASARWRPGGGPVQAARRIAACRTFPTGQPAPILPGARPRRPARGAEAAHDRSPIRDGRCGTTSDQSPGACGRPTGETEP